MAATYLAKPQGCPDCTGINSVVLLSVNGGRRWKMAGEDAGGVNKQGYMSGISQFVVLKNGSWLALGRGGSNAPVPSCPGLTRSISTDEGVSWSRGWQTDLWPLGGGVRHVFFRLQEGPLLLISFTGGSNITTVSGKTRRFRGLYAATSTDEGDSFTIQKPLVDETAPASAQHAMDKIPWTMTNATAEPRGYTSARQTMDGMIHVVSSRNSYHFNLAWLLQPAPDAPDAPVGPSPGPSPGPSGPPIPAGTWYTRHADWEMHSPTAKRTIRALKNTTICSTAACSVSGRNTTVEVAKGWSFVLLAPPVGKETWELQCPCTRLGSLRGLKSDDGAAVDSRAANWTSAEHEHVLAHKTDDYTDGFHSTNESNDRNEGLVAAKIISVSPATFAVEGTSSSEHVTVVGSGFAAAGAAAVCMISSPPSKHSTTFRFGGGGYPGGNGLNISFPAHVQNSTHLFCRPPAVLVGGAGLLLVSMDNGSSFSNAVPIRYAALMGVVIGRRPYLSEDQGSLLLMPSPRLHGLHLSVTAELPCANWSTSWRVEIANSSIVLKFPLAALPKSINNDLKIEIAGIPWRDNQLVLWRRLIRQFSVATATTGPTEPSQVDHHIRALRVQGEPFVGQGWFVYGGFAWAGRSIDMLFAPVKRQAELGINMVMPYNLNYFNITDQRLYLDWCHAAGVKVLYPMVYFTGATNTNNYGRDWESPAWLAAVSANVSGVKDHPAILGYYM